jgi:hypothetical protein
MNLSLQKLQATLHIMSSIFTACNTVLAVSCLHVMFQVLAGGGVLQLLTYCIV